MQIKSLLLRKTTLLVLILLFFVIELFVYSTKDNEKELSYLDRRKIYNFELNHNLDFCGEKVPLYSQDILERYEREILKNAHWHSEITLMFKRSGRYFPSIEKILKENGVPEDFKYLCVIESGLDNVVSPAGASGFWQIMEKTGQEYGLVINEQIDERYHLEKSTKAACKYFKEAYKKFGSWTLVAASYNLGMTGLEKKLEIQGVSNYYDLHLNTETARYLFRILAIKEILTKPDKFNYELSFSDKYKPFPVKVVSLDSSVSNLAKWAEKQNINYKILKMFNPWIKTNELNTDYSQNYQLTIPTGEVYTFKNDTLNPSKVSSTQNSGLE